MGKGVSRVALLDVNVLVALFAPDHVHHDLAHDWFAEQREHGWATCPLTENGAVRVMSNPAYGLERVRLETVVARFRKFRSSGHHVFWSDAVSLADDRLLNWEMASGHRQVTDIYLLALAVQMKGCLATFDRTIPMQTVTGATSNAIQVISPAA